MVFIPKLRCVKDNPYSQRHSEGRREVLPLQVRNAAAEYVQEQPLPGSCSVTEKDGIDPHLCSEGEGVVRQNPALARRSGRRRRIRARFIRAATPSVPVSFDVEDALAFLAHPSPAPVALIIEQVDPLPQNGQLAPRRRRATTRPSSSRSLKSTRIAFIGAAPPHKEIGLSSGGLKTPSSASQSSSVGGPSNVSATWPRGSLSASIRYPVPYLPDRGLPHRGMRQKA